MYARHVAASRGRDQKKGQVVLRTEAESSTENQVAVRVLADHCMKMMAKIQFFTLHVVSKETLGISCLHNRPLYKAGYMPKDRVSR